VFSVSFPKALISVEAENIFPFIKHRGIHGAGHGDEVAQKSGLKPRGSFIAEGLIIRNSTGPAPIQPKS
jgi:hypothetical protein